MKSGDFLQGRRPARDLVGAEQRTAQRVPGVAGVRRDVERLGPHRLKGDVVGDAVQGDAPGVRQPALAGQPHRRLERVDDDLFEQGLPGIGDVAMALRQLRARPSSGLELLHPLLELLVRDEIEVTLRVEGEQRFELLEERGRSVRRQAHRLALVADVEAAVAVHRVVEQAGAALGEIEVVQRPAVASRVHDANRPGQRAVAEARQLLPAGVDREHRRLLEAALPEGLALVDFVVLDAAGHPGIREPPVQLPAQAELARGEVTLAGDDEIDVGRRDGEAAHQPAHPFVDRVLEEDRRGEAAAPGAQRPFHLPVDFRAGIADRVVLAARKHQDVLDPRPAIEHGTPDGSVGSHEGDAGAVPGARNTQNRLNAFRPPAEEAIDAAAKGLRRQNGQQVVRVVREFAVQRHGHVSGECATF